MVCSTFLGIFKINIKISFVWLWRIERDFETIMYGKSRGEGGDTITGLTGDKWERFDSTEAIRRKK